MKVLLLEDDFLLSELLVEHLNDKGYEVVHFVDGDKAWEYLYENGVDLLLLDVNVPSLSGFELLKNIREQNITTPTIMITSLNDAKDVKNGFDFGCDEYIKKPFEFEEFDARVEHVLKIYNLKSDLLDVGCCKFDYKRAVLLKNNKQINLTQKASQILYHLFSHKNKIVSKEELVQNIWDYDDMPTDATIRSYIKLLRQHIPNIKTHRGRGYEFISS